MSDNYDGHWWNDPLGLTKILRSQGTLDEDECYIEPHETKSDLRKWQEEQRKDWCVDCQWEHKERLAFPCNSCNRNLDANFPECGDSFIKKKVGDDYEE